MAGENMYLMRLVIALLLVSVIITGCGSMRRNINMDMATIKAPIMRSVKTNPQIELRFGIPHTEYEVNRDYIVEAVLVSRSFREQILSATGGMRDIFYVVVTDKNNQNATIDTQTVEVSSQGSERAQLYAEKLKIRFKKPGEYRIFCQLNNAFLRTTLGPTGNVTFKPINLKTEPVNIRVSNTALQNYKTTIKPTSAVSDLTQPKITIQEVIRNHIPKSSDTKVGETYLEFPGKRKGNVMPILTDEMQKAGWVLYDALGSKKFFVRNFNGVEVKISVLPREGDGSSEKSATTFVYLELATD